MKRLGKVAFAAVLVGVIATPSAAGADPLRILLPTSAASITDLNADGTGDLLSAGAVVSRTSRTVQAAHLEYDISGLTPGNVRWASVEFVVYPERFLYTGARVLGFYVYDADGVVDTGDFELPGVFVGKATFTPGLDPSVGGWAIQIPVKHQVRAALEQGAASIGIRFVPLNQQPSSGLVNYEGNGFSSSVNHPPFLIVNPAPIPEPASMVLVGSGVVALVAGARRRRHTSI